MNVEQTHLLKYLKAGDAVYYGQVLKLRERITGFLEYTRQSFPTYTTHTASHSEEIIAQLSQLLFIDDKPTEPLVTLSMAEVYILAVAAYLHDAGMVVSDEEKSKILDSEEWKIYISADNPGFKRWDIIKSFREGLIPKNDDQRNFLADVQLRFLIAEFVRKSHSRRVSDIITENRIYLGDFVFENPLLERTIIDVCIAHGLSQHELLDTGKYPDRRDIRGEKVNVRFMALLLRIGDLLDMTIDRACPLLLNAACPIPPDSLAHWTHYSGISHQLTAPDRIELTAYCDNQSEHRFLEDWCNWLVSEVREAGNIMIRSARHSNWKPPKVDIEGDSPTIVIKPSSTANYIPFKWKFELDPNMVFQRLIRDVNVHEIDFIRELLQNSLDATRCQLYIDLAKKGLLPPEYPTQVDEQFLKLYPIKITLSEREIHNELSGEPEKYQVLTIEDQGLGMDKYIIENYFLQIGRSFYTTDEFQRAFRFIPTSRFGIGFLSVFSVSNHVKVDTYKPSSKTGDKALCLTLTGPRNYFLIENGSRKGSGTTIEVLLRNKLTKNTVSDYVHHLCKRVEFPIIINELGTESIVTPESFKNFEYDIPVKTKQIARFILKAYPINKNGIEGEVYFFAMKDEKGNIRFDKFRWAQDDYPDIDVTATQPTVPGNLVCFNGISMYNNPGSSRLPFSYRIDIRRKLDLPMSRQRRLDFVDFPEVSDIIQLVLTEHLAKSEITKPPDGWIYKNRLIDAFELETFWDSIPEMVKVSKNGASVFSSFNELLYNDNFVLTIKAEHVFNFDLIKCSKKAPIESNPVKIEYENWGYIEKDYRNRLMKNREVSISKDTDNGRLTIQFRLMQDKKNQLVIDPYDSLLIFFARLQDPNIISMHIKYGCIIFNEDNLLAQWVQNITNSEDPEKIIITEQLDKILKLLRSAAVYATREEELKRLSEFLQGWKHSQELPQKFIPPEIVLKKSMFVNVTDDTDDIKFFQSLSKFENRLG